MINVAHACLVLLVATSTFVPRAASEPGISAATMTECSRVSRVLSDRKEYAIKKETGIALLLNKDDSRFARKGCVVIVSGDYPVAGEKLPPDQVITHYFINNGWRADISYLADGPGSGQNAYVKEVDDGGDTLCITRWVSDAALDSPPSFQSLRVTCVDSRERNDAGE